MERCEQYDLIHAPCVMENRDFLDFHGHEDFGLGPTSPTMEADAGTYWTPAFNILTMTVTSRHDIVTLGEESLVPVDEVLRLIPDAQDGLYGRPVR